MVLMGFSGNAKESSYFAYLGIPIIIGVILGWLAISGITVDGTSSSFINMFSVPEK